MSTTQINAKAMPTNSTDYSCHKSYRTCLSKFVISKHKLYIDYVVYKSVKCFFCITKSKNSVVSQHISLPNVTYLAVYMCG